MAKAYSRFFREKFRFLGFLGFNVRTVARGTLRAGKNLRFLKKVFRFFRISVLMSRPNRNRNLRTSKALLKSQAHQGTSLFTSAATNQRGVSKGGSREAQVRIPEYQEGRRPTHSRTQNIGHKNAIN